MRADHPPVLHPERGPNAPSAKGPAPLVFGGPKGASTSLAGVRVLVVEDDDDSRELICRVLGMAGATLLCVESVAKAMEGVYHSFDPDVVLTDYSMPDADGLDLIREFRKAPATRPVAVPILILSGHAADHWRARALEAGAWNVLTKPFAPAALIAQIAAAAAPGRASRPGFPAAPSAKEHAPVSK